MICHGEKTPSVSIVRGESSAKSGATGGENAKLHVGEHLRSSIFFENAVTGISEPGRPAGAV